MTITKVFYGNRYNITVESDARDGYFEIFAMHKNSGRKSAVTNINTVIAEMLAPILKTENIQDTGIWIDDKSKHKRLVHWTVRCLKDRNWIVKYLEKAFDEDMELGGWNSEVDEIQYERFTESSIKRLTSFSQIIQEAAITNYDYKILVQADGNNVFLFLDPPYYSATKSALYGKNGHLHKAFNHLEFAEIMKTCPHKWLITYDDSKYIRDLFSFASIIPWNLKYGMRNVTETSNQNGKEIFVSNYLETASKQLSLF